MKYYLVGIKGTGMSALAMYLKDLGNEVVGSDDEVEYFTTKGLKEKNIPIYCYNATNIDETFTYIVGLSIDIKNVEFKKIVDNEYEFYYYNNFIATFIDKKMIAVSGTHGKTSTTWFINKLSGISSIVGCGYGVGNGSEYIAVEACEYKNHFHAYTPYLLIIQSLDLDHPDFFKSKRKLFDSYQKMAEKSNIVLINGDHDIAKKIKHQHLYTFGFKDTNDYVIKIIKESVDGYSILLKGNKICRILSVKLYGIYNLYDFVAAYLSCLICKLQVVINDLTLPAKRMKEITYGKTILIDDYAHHPSELKALENSLRMKYPLLPLKVIFQSHTYSRTLKYRKDFKKVLKKFDDVYLMNVFSSKRETENIAYQKKIDRYFKDFKKYNDDVLNLISKDKNEIWIFLGAGLAGEKINNIIKKNENE